MGDNNLLNYLGIGATNVVSFVQMAQDCYIRFNKWINQLHVQKTILSLLEFAKTLPDFIEEIEGILSVMEKVFDEIGSSGFSVILETWSFSECVELVFCRVIEADEKYGKILLEVTQSDNFRKEILSFFEECQIFSNNEKQAIDEGLQCHQNEQYYAATRTLIPSIESMLTSYLIYIGKAKRENGKVWELDENGQIRLNKNGKRMEFRGIDSKFRATKNATGKDSNIIPKIEKGFKTYNPLRHGETGFTPDLKSTLVTLELQGCLCYISSQLSLKKTV